MSAQLPLHSRIKRLLIWFFGLAFLFSALFVVGIEYQKQSVQLNRIMQGRVKVGLISIRRLLDADVALLDRFAGLISRLPEQRAALFEQEQLLNEAERLFYLLSASGKVTLLASKHRHLLGLDFSRLAHVKAGRQVSEVHQSLITNQSVISLSKSLADGSTLVMERNLATLIPPIDALSKGELLAEEILFILSRDGTVVHHPDPELVSARHNLGLEIKWSERWHPFGLALFRLYGESFVAHRQRLEARTGWSVIYAVPARLLILSTLKELAYQFLLLLVIFTTLFSALAITLNRYFSVPVKSMVAHLDRYSAEQGERVIPASINHGIEEFGRITRSINDMATAVRGSQVELQESNLRFRQIAESIYDVFWLGELVAPGEFKMLFVSPGYERLWKRPAAELYDENPSAWQSVIHPNDRERVQQAFARFLQDRGSFDLEFTLLRADGSIRYVESHANLVDNDQHRAVRAAGTIRDITARVTAARETKRLRTLLGDIINAMPSVVVTVDKECHVMQWNHAAEQWSGKTRGTAMGALLFDLVPGLTALNIDIQQAVAGGLPYQCSKMPWPQEDEKHFLDITLYPLLDEEVDGAVLRIDDVTQRVRMDETMVQSEKMLSVGGLAAGMAHEINNPLAGILQNAQVMQRRLFEDLSPNLRVAKECGITLPAMREYLRSRRIDEITEHISDAARRAARIVENMLSFSRKSEGNKSEEDLALLMERTLELAANDYDLKKNYDFRDTMCSQHRGYGAKMARSSR